MIRTIYTALSGMTAYRQGLDTLSNNVANLNTPGFKAGVPLFLDVVNRTFGEQQRISEGKLNSGGGVRADTTPVSAKQGELRSTGNSLDAAIDGQGYFVLEKNGERYFTRAGQFEFDENGFLVDRTSQAKVLVSGEDNAVSSLNIEALRAYAPKPTANIYLAGNLARTGTATYELPGLTVNDAAGGSQQFTVKFVRSAADPLKWAVEVRNLNGVVVGSTNLEFSVDGTPIALAAPFTLRVEPEGMDAFNVEIHVGTPGKYSGVTSLANDAQSQLQILRQDGIKPGSLTTVSFDEKGVITLNYSNGQKLTPATLLLARFRNSAQPLSLGGSLYRAPDDMDVPLGTALSSGLGRLVGGQLELSNVELTEQFTDLIIIQRGYQASSQMGSVANEMLQQLLAMGQGR